jgi:hypothetical protein
MIRATFKLKLCDLDMEIIEKIKHIFTSEDIVEINVSDEIDEVDYLLSTPANRESLKRSLEQFKNRQFVSKQASEL